jgi:TonB family protein
MPFLTTGGFVILRFSIRIGLSSAAAAVVLGSHYIAEGFPFTRLPVPASSVDRAIDRSLAQQTTAPPAMAGPQSPPPPPGSASSGGAAAAQKNPACSPNASPASRATNRPHVYIGPDKTSTPTRIVYVRPGYPRNARAAKVQGVVLLETEIDTDGRVCSARVLRSIPLLDQSAINAVLRWRFTPAKVNDVAVPVIMPLTVNFTLPQ